MSSVYYWADRFLPAPAKRLASALVVEVSRRIVRVRHRSRYDAIVHCCVQKTASRWMKRLLVDSLTYRYSGMRHTNFQPEVGARQGFPLHSIIGPLYVDFSTYSRTKGASNALAFFVMRDPRDIAVSWYFSLKHSHDRVSTIEQERTAVSEMAVPEGIAYSIERQSGAFESLRSWHEAAKSDGGVVLVRYEDLTGSNSFPCMRDLFLKCDIAIPDHALRDLLDKYSFKQMSGRERGVEDVTAKYRKGVAGDWKNYFDDAVKRRFHEVAGDLVSALGYEEDEAW